MVFWLEAAVLAVVGVLAGSIVFSTLRTGIGPMPSSAAARAELVKLLPQDLDGEVLELGSGWGGLALTLARAAPRARVIGIERSWVPLLWSRLRLRLSGPANCRFVWADFQKLPLGSAQVVVCYLFRGGMQKLAPKLSSELAPGALVLSNTFALTGWTCEATVVAQDLWKSPVYRYRVPARSA